jgi:hypothetical protein
MYIRSRSLVFIFNPDTAAISRRYSAYMANYISLSSSCFVSQIQWRFSGGSNSWMSLLSGSWDSAVGIATGYRLDDRGVGVRVPVASRIFSSPRRPDRLWGPPSLLSNGHQKRTHRGASSNGKATQACWIFLRPWRWRRYVPPKRQLLHNGLHGVISQKMILFITTAVKTSNPTQFFYCWVCIRCRGNVFTELLPCNDRVLLPSSCLPTIRDTNIDIQTPFRWA